MTPTISEAVRIAERYLLAGRLDVELFEALRVLTAVADDVLHADVQKYLD